VTVVDASIIVRLLQNRRGDEALQERLGRQRHLHAPALIDAEVASAVRGLMLTAKSGIRIGIERADDMLADYEQLPIVRHPMQPLQRRVLGWRDNLTAYDAFYLALAELLDMPLLTDDRKFARAPIQAAAVETWR